MVPDDKRVGLEVDKSVTGTLDEVGTPLVRELNEVFARHGFDGGFVYAAFAQDGERWRYDSGAVVGDGVPECEHQAVLQDAAQWVFDAVNDIAPETDEDLEMDVEADDE